MAPPKSKNAERVAEWRKRQKEDPELYEKYKEKERERYKRKKEKGLIKMASEMTQKELKGKRSQWKKNQRGKRERDKMMVAHVQNLITPPNSPEPHHLEERGQRNHVIKRGRKKVRKDRARAYREIFLLRVKLAQEKKLKEKYKKRLQRVHKKGNEDDVLKKADEMIRNRSSRKALILHNIMVRNIRNRYKCSSHETRRMISSLIGRHNVLTKYRLQNYARKVLGIRQRKTQHRQIRIEVGETRIKKDIREFMERDDNSRIKAGKKSTITRKKEGKKTNQTVE
ncbi:hypothetical protein FSP39_023306 [Pinctada imbricata]|uniref:Uncharacterized protein n=1 Tax=Pinctada imbricata TaxID=66713 RepID=A0AA89C0X9_PINIB|nr:hypothetical protein FSP39_023306 [Pinctada imbricata]